MKKSLIKVFSLMLVFIFLTSCAQMEDSSKTGEFGQLSIVDEDVGGDTDLDFNRSFSHISSQICSTEDTVYFAYSGLIYYCDKATGITAPLCGKPECTHDNANCNAYLYSNAAYGLTDYNGRLYWVGSDGGLNWKVYSIAYDGTDRRTVRELERELIGSRHDDLFIQFHRGFLYWACLTNGVVEGKAAYVARICAFPLEPNEEGTVILEEEINGYARIQPYGNSLYIAFTNSSTADDRFVYELAMYQWDIQTEELKKLYNGTIPLSVYEMWVVEDGVLLHGDIRTGTDESHSYQRTVCKFLFESGEVVPLFDLVRFSPSEFIYACSVVEGMFVMNSVNGSGEMKLLVMDFDGRTILDMTIKADWLNFNYPMQCHGADETYLYFYLGMGSDYVAAVPRDGSGIRLLWAGDE